MATHHYRQSAAPRLPAIPPGIAHSSEIALEWKVNTPGLLREIMSNTGTGILSIPINIFARLLNDVATRASQLNDRELNKLMLQLALYEAADPNSPLYDKKLLKEYGL